MCWPSHPTAQLQQDARVSPCTSHDKGWFWAGWLKSVGKIWNQQKSLFLSFFYFPSDPGGTNRMEFASHADASSISPDLNQQYAVEKGALRFLTGCVEHHDLLTPPPHKCLTAERNSSRFLHWIICVTTKMRFLTVHTRFWFEGHAVEGVSQTTVRLATIWISSVFDVSFN